MAEAEVKNQETKVVKIEKKDEDQTRVKLSKTYEFEGRKIDELDLSGLENLTADDLVRAGKIYANNGNISAVRELDLEYTLTVAADISDLPIEFYHQLSARDAMKVKNRVTNFIYGED